MSIDERPAAESTYEMLPQQEEPTVAWRPSTEPSATIGKSRWYQRGFGHVAVKYLVNFCRQFASYLDAGINLYRALESLRRQYEWTALGPVIGRLQLAVRRGQSLTDAMSREPAAFDYYFLSMMRVGEVRGSVPETLRLLSVEYESRQRMVRQTKSALIYPAFVIFVSVTVSALLTILVLPPLVNIMQEVIHERHVDLPLPTRLLIRISDFISDGGWWGIPLTLVGTVAFFVGAYRLERGKALLDVVLMRLPIVGQLLWKIDTTRFCRTLATLLDAGVDIGSSLELTADTLFLVPMRRAVLQTRNSIIRGESLSASIELTNRFPPDIPALMNSGEETGRLPEMMLMVADQYEEQVEFIVKNLGTLLQPVITVVVGGVVFFIAVAFFMGYAAVLANLGQSKVIQ
ncbi:MAG TPA: type II secretion system F family protein [Isosphaeraceae bacterium]|jgi:type II secretory pathway component PulF|nr:type II secretion system F family protein [Isosphaeraceae bacterium]